MRFFLSPYFEDVSWYFFRQPSRACSDSSLQLTPYHLCTSMNVTATFSFINFFHLIVILADYCNLYLTFLYK